jgi:hypothetical protein
MGPWSRIKALFKRGARDATASPWTRDTQPRFLVDPHIPIERCIVDNRVFLLGLDQLYREAMKEHERAELLHCAKSVAAALGIAPADVPVEGYYADDPLLTEYFLLMRALQEVAETRARDVAAMPAFRRLRDVASAPLYGRPVWEDKLLPVGRDALSQALLNTRPDWTVPQLVAAAYAAARETDDISLVALAALARDPVVLVALRESVVLYAWRVCLGLPPPREFVWQVDEEVAKQARRFVDAFNALFGNELPPPTPEQAQHYWLAFDDVRIIGRCVRLGADPTEALYYHWGICRDLNQQLTIQEFWRPEVWTTERYRGAIGLDGRCRDLESGVHTGSDWEQG